MRGTSALVAILVVVLIGSVVMIRSKNYRIAELEQQAASANGAVESQQGAVLIAQMRLESFKEELAREARQVMLKNVTAAAVIGRAIEAGCAPGYTNPRCDTYFDESAAGRGVDALKSFALWREVQHYGPILCGPPGEPPQRREAD
jgi:hypothetical protein